MLFLKDIQAMKDFGGLLVDQRLFPLQYVQDTPEWKGITIFDDEKMARCAVKEGLFGHWKWSSGSSGNRGNRYAHCNDHIDCQVRLRLKLGLSGCEVSLNVAQEHSLIPNDKKRKNSSMPFEQERMSHFAVTTSMRTQTMPREYQLISCCIIAYHPISLCIRCLLIICSCRRSATFTCSK